MIAAGDIARMLAQSIDRLVQDLLPAGKRQGSEWRVGSVTGEPGHSLGVHLIGVKAGVWSDFGTGAAGDPLDLVRVVLGVDSGEALRWSRSWLGIEYGTAELPTRRMLPPAAKPEPSPDPDRWHHPWNAAVPIVRTLAAAYLAGRGLQFDDPEGTVLRFAARRARLGPDDQLEHHPALLALLRGVRTGEPTGIINIYLRPDGSDRLRDSKGKTNTGRSGAAAVMLSAFDEPTHGLVIGEGIESVIALLMAGLSPAWACAGAGNVSAFPILPGIEALTIAADADKAGQLAAEKAAQRWREAGREIAIVAPLSGDWADARRTAA